MTGTTWGRPGKPRSIAGQLDLDQRRGGERIRAGNDVSTAARRSRVSLAARPGTVDEHAYIEAPDDLLELFDARVKHLGDLRVLGLDLGCHRDELLRVAAHEYGRLRRLVGADRWWRLLVEDDRQLRLWRPVPRSLDGTSGASGERK
jgi:hypothetical protein